MLARRYAAAALGVYDLGNVGGGVGLATPPPPTPPFSPFIMSPEGEYRDRGDSQRKTRGKRTQRTTVGEGGESTKTGTDDTEETGTIVNKNSENGRSFSGFPRRDERKRSTHAVHNTGQRAPNASRTCARRKHDLFTADRAVHTATAVPRARSPADDRCPRLRERRRRQHHTHRHPRRRDSRTDTARARCPIRHQCYQ